MNDITIVPLASSDRYMVYHRLFKQISYFTMQQVIKQKIGFEHGAIVSNLITGGPEWVYLIERQYE